MKTALCFLGTGRSIQHTFENLQRNVIDPFDDRDVIVYITDTPDAKKTEEYFKTLDDVFIHTIKEAPLDVSKYKFLSGWPPSTGSDLDKGRHIYLQMLKSRSVMNSLIEQTENDYDRVLFSRMDVIYENSIRESVDKLDLSKVWLPHFHHWIGGYNDRFAVSSREGMRNYFSLYDHIDKYAEEGHIFHAENTLKHHLNMLEVDVGVFKVRFSRIRNGKPHDKFNSLDNEASIQCDI